MNWDQKAAIELCRQLYPICPEFGCYPALTGGTLYKDGMRKDCDILFYRIRSVPVVDVAGLFKATEAIGLHYVKGGGWCVKATWHGLPVDCFFPESPGDQTHSSEEAQAVAAQITAELISNSVASSEDSAR